MGRNSNRIKDRATEICESDAYQEARDEAFNEFFKDTILIQGVNTNLEKLVVTEDDIQGLIDSFTFQDEDEWCMEKSLSELDDINDQKYQEWKERDI